MNREEFLAARDKSISTPIEVTIKGWGKIHLREYTIGDSDEYLANKENKETERKQLARNACRRICDEHGKRLFDPNNEKDVEEMADVPARVLRAIDQAGTDASQKAEAGKVDSAGN